MTKQEKSIANVEYERQVHRNDLANLAYTFLNTKICVGGRMVCEEYICPHCGSVDPDEVCNQPINDRNINE